VDKGSKSSTKFSLPWAKVACHFHSREQNFQGTNVPGSESSICRTFAPRNESTWKRKFHNSLTVYVPYISSLSASTYRVCTYRVPLHLVIADEEEHDRYQSLVVQPWDLEGRQSTKKSIWWIRSFSRWFLKELMLGASTASCGRLFHRLILGWEKKTFFNSLHWWLEWWPLSRHWNSLTFPWQCAALMPMLSGTHSMPVVLTTSLTFPWHVSNSLTFPGFPDKWSPWTWYCSSKTINNINRSNLISSWPVQVSSNANFSGNYYYF